MKHIKINSYNFRNDTIESYNFLSETIERMKHLSKSTKNNELGFNLCSDKNNDVRAKHECEGSECEFKSTHPGQCDRDEKFIGTFHTHPRHDNVDPSAGDLYNVQTQGVGCIGISNGKVKCYTKTDPKTISKFYDEKEVSKQLERKLHDLKYYEAITKWSIDEEIRSERLKDINESINELFKKGYFKAHEI